MSKIAIIGQGNMGRTHAQSWTQIGREDDIRYILTRRERLWLEPAPRAQAVGSLDEILDDPEVDIVSICTPTPSHVDLAIRSLRAGKNVLLEKPIALTLPHAKAIAQAAKDAGTTLMIAHVVRFFAGYRELRDIWRAGRIGSLVSVRATRMCETPTGVDWLADEAQSGGVVVDFAIHDYDQVNLFLGTPMAVTAIRTSPDGPIETTIEYRNGGIGQVLSYMGLPAGTPFTSTIEVVGSSGWASYRFTAGDDENHPEGLRTIGSRGESDVSIVDSGGRTSYHVAAGQPYARQAEYFLSRVESGHPPDECPTEAAIAALSVSLAARESLKRGCRIILHEDHGIVAPA